MSMAFYLYFILVIYRFHFYLPLPFFHLCDLQDSQIQELKEQVESMSSQNEQMQTTVSQQLAQIQQHKDQYNILKLKIGGFISLGD